MEEKEWLTLLSGKNQLQKVMDMNAKTERFGLSLTEEDARMLVEKRLESLKEQQRVEFGEGILPKPIFTFCDSPYLDQGNYADTIAQLQEIFYLYKNESMDELSDDELLSLMKEAFDGECQGSLDFLQETVLEKYARKIRSDGRNFFGGKFEE